MNAKKILLFGAQGMLGTQIFNESLEREDIEIIPLSRFNGDFTQPEKLEEIIEKFTSEEKIDAVVNTAAFTLVDKCEDPKYFELNVQINTIAPGIIAQKCEEKNIPFFHFSTDYVFSGEVDQVFTENSKPNPCNEYGKAKEKGEENVLKYSTAKVLRTAWLSGENGANFVHKMVHLSKTSKNINVVTQERGNPTFCQDVSNALFELLLNTEKYPEKIYHLVNEGNASRKELVEEIQNFLELSTGLSDKASDFFELPAKRPASSVLKNTLFPPLPTWQEGLQKFLAGEKEKFDKKREIEEKKERAKKLYREKQAEEREEK